MKIKKTLAGTLLAAALASMMLTGCRDDDLFNTDVSEIPSEPSLVFDFQIMSMGDDGSGSGFLDIDDHGEDWENYIDPSKFRVIFTDRDGYYLFEVDRSYITVITKEHSWLGTTNHYRVFLPQKALYSQEHTEAQNDAIQKAIEKEGFKVAVMANWPNLMEGVRRIDPETGDELVATPDIDTRLNFVFAPGDTSIANNHISFLSHCFYDNVYGALSGGKLPEAYKHLTLYDRSTSTEVMPDGGQMGMFTSWVSYLYPSQGETARLIRAGKNSMGDILTGDINFSYRAWFDEGKSGMPEYFHYTPYSYTRKVEDDEDAHDVTDANTYSLENIWRLWNFGYGNSCKFHAECGPDVKPYWERRNRYNVAYQLDNLKSWPTAFNILENDGSVGFQSNNSKTRYVAYQEGNSESGYITLPAAVKSADLDTMDMEVFKEETVKLKDSEKYQKLCETFRESAIMIKAYGEGVLRIRAKASDKDGENHGRIAVIMKNPFRADTEKIQYITERELLPDGSIRESKTNTDSLYTYPLPRGSRFIEGQEYAQSGEYIIQPNSTEYMEVYIAAVNGEVDIYEVEFMRSRQIYDSARNAIMPSADNPIPMYGIQNFDPLGTARLLPLHTFNMSDINENGHLKGIADPDDDQGRDLMHSYRYKNIFLLRSLAKVEVRFNKEVFKNNPPLHVFMRVMNRSARCEPKDVVNPTDWIWYGAEGWEATSTMEEGRPQTPIDDGMDNLFVGVQQEFENIMKYNRSFPLYVANNSSFEEYLKRTSWYHAVWGSGVGARYGWAKPWDWNESETGFNKEKIPGSGIPSPRVFNTRIDRSDFCRFHRVADKDGYYRYVMYVPEKNVSDTDSKGNLGASPKVQHIEVRFANMNDVLNFDDNNCYRIYFTDYSADNGKGFNDEYYRENNSQRPNTKTFDDFEKEKLGILQPVIRNCYYLFTVDNINNNNIGVNLKVCTEANRSTSFTIE